MKDYPCKECGPSTLTDPHPYWMEKLSEPLKPKGIDIVMTCGEIHHIDTEQPAVDTVSFNGEQLYPQMERIKHIVEIEKIESVQDFARLMSRMTGHYDIYTLWFEWFR